MLLRRLLSVCALGTLAFPALAPPARAAAPPPVVPAGWPKLLAIPKIAVKSTVEAVTFDHRNDYHAPFRWGDVAWYSKGPRPGDSGRAQIYGHLDSLCCPAVFYELKRLNPGDNVQITYRNAKPLTFRVQWTTTFPNKGLPVKFMYAPVKERGLILMTCSGTFHRDGSGYDHKRFVYARLVLPNGRLG